MHSVFLPTRPGQNVRGIISITPSKPRIEPLAKENWPRLLKIVAKYRHPADLGLGDTLVHLIGDTNSSRFKTWFKRKFNRDCGCTDRQRWLNARFPHL